MLHPSWPSFVPLIVATVACGAPADLPASPVQVSSSDAADTASADAPPPRTTDTTVDAAVEPVPKADVTPPELLFTNVTDGLQLSGAFTVQVLATDDVAVASVTYFVAGAKVATITAPPFSYVWATGAAANGGTLLTATALDSAGNASLPVAAKVTIANPWGTCGAGPVVGWVYPAEGQQVCAELAPEVTVTQGCSASKVSYLVDGMPIDLPWQTTAVADGPHLLTAVDSDDSGQKGQATLVVSVVNGQLVCNNPPVVHVISPAGGAVVAGPVIVSAAAAAQGMGNVLSEVRLFADAQLLGVLKQPPWQATWDTALFSEGAHEIRAIAKDAKGVQSQHAVGAVLDQTPPQVQFAAPADGAVLSDDSTPVAWLVKASDQFGLAGVTFLAVHGTQQIAVGAVTSSPYQLKWSTQGLASGEWQLVAIAKDVAGHSAKAQIAVTLDRPPTVAIVAPSGAAAVAGVVPVEILANDDLGLASLTLAVDGAVAATLTVDAGAKTAKLVYPWSTVGLAQGPHTLVATVSDTLGHVSTTSSVVIVDQPLVVTVATCGAAFAECGPLPPANTEVTGLSHWLVTVVDDNATASAIGLSVDGKLVQTQASAPAQLTWNSQPVPDGPHALAFDVTTTLGQHVQVKLALVINNCDLDHDGATSVQSGCGGSDCDDGDAKVSANAADSLGDGKDQNCDGADGIDADGDGVASLPSGGSDCDDKSAAVSPKVADATVDGTDQNCDGFDGVDKDGDKVASVASGGKDCDDTSANVYPGAKDTVVPATCSKPTVSLTSVATLSGATLMSAVTDAKGFVHIAYLGLDGAIGYARALGPKLVPETAVASFIAFKMARIAVDNGGNPQVLFANAKTGAFMVAVRAVGKPDPVGEPVWKTTEVIDAKASGGVQPAMVFDAAGKRHVAYYDQMASAVRYATDSSGVWVNSIVDAGKGVMDGQSIALDSSGGVHIAYYSGVYPGAMIASKVKGKWTTALAVNAMDAAAVQALRADKPGSKWLAYTAWDKSWRVATQVGGLWQSENPALGGQLNGHYSLAVAPPPLGVTVALGGNGPQLAWKAGGTWQALPLGPAQPAFSIAAAPRPDGSVAAVYVDGQYAVHVAVVACPPVVLGGGDENCDGVDGVDGDGDKIASLASGGTDCDDANAKIYPAALDSWGDSIDQNCDGADGVDQDGDKAASLGSGGADCDDADPTVGPLAKDGVGDSVDQNCDGLDGVDKDGDLFASLASGGTDCDDNSGLVFPCAGDIGGDGVDSNCDGKDATDCGDCQLCTVDTFSGGKCSHAWLPEAAPCEDGDLCTTGEACSAKVCVGGKKVSCDDTNPCTDDSCDGSSGKCQFLANKAPCDVDGKPCTIDVCQGKTCTAGVTVVCDDKNPCTNDTCDAKAGKCLFQVKTGACEADGSLCTLDLCSGGYCYTAQYLNCDDANGCTNDICDSKSGKCQHISNTAACNLDAEPCTADVCMGGLCTPGGPANCDDGNACTDDSCKTGFGCLKLPNTAPCNDQNLCTAGDQCQQGYCYGKSPVQCNDNDSCTTDYCQPSTGCAKVPDTKKCNDGNACTIDSCASPGGACSNVAIADCCTTAKDCDDAVPCTFDACVANKCQHSPSGTCCSSDSDCDDKDAVCTVDTCVAGLCSFAPTGKPGCCLPILWQENFDDANPLATWLISNSVSAKQGWQLWSTPKAPPGAKSTPAVLYYGDPLTNNFNFGTNAGTVMTPVIKIPIGSKPSLKVWVYKDTEMGGGYDALAIEVVKGGVTAILLSDGAGTYTFQGWKEIVVDLKAYVGADIVLRFTFQTKDSVGNTGLGILVDDMRITNTCP